MSKEAESGPTSIREPIDVLGYLLKHAHHALEARTDAALARFGITSRYPARATSDRRWRRELAAGRRPDPRRGPNIDGRTARRT